MSLSPVLVICLMASLLNSSCNNKDKHSGYLDMLIPGDSLKLWHNDSHYTNLFETIWIVRQQVGFKARYFVERNNSDWTAVIKGETTINKIRPVIYTVIDTSKAMSANDEETVNRYILAMQMRGRSPTDSNAETVQGFVLFSKKLVEIGTNTNRNWKVFDTVKRNIFNIQ